MRNRAKSLTESHRQRKIFDGTIIAILTVITAIPIITIITIPTIITVIMFIPIAIITIFTIITIINCQWRRRLYAQTSIAFLRPGPAQCSSS